VRGAPRFVCEFIFANQLAFFQSGSYDASKRLAEAVAVDGPDLDVMALYAGEMKKADQPAARSRVEKDPRKISRFVGGDGD